MQTHNLISKLSLFIIGLIILPLLNSCYPEFETLKRLSFNGNEIDSNKKIDRIKIVKMNNKYSGSNNKYFGLYQGKTAYLLDTSLDVYLQDALNRLICKDTNSSDIIPVTVDIENFHMTDLIINSYNALNNKSHTDCVLSYLGLNYKLIFSLEINNVKNQVVFNGEIKKHDCLPYHYPYDYERFLKSFLIKLSKAYLNKISADTNETIAKLNTKYMYQNDYDKLVTDLGISLAENVDINGKVFKGNGVSFSYYNGQSTEAGYIVSILNWSRSLDSTYKLFYGLSCQGGHANSNSESFDFYSINVPLGIRYYLYKPLYVSGFIAPGFAGINSLDNLFLGANYELGIGYDWTTWLSTDIGFYGHNYLNLPKLRNEIGFKFGINFKFETYVDE